MAFLYRYPTKFVAATGKRTINFGHGLVSEILTDDGTTPKLITPRTVSPAAGAADVNKKLFWIGGTYNTGGGGDSADRKLAWLMRPYFWSYTPAVGGGDSVNISFDSTYVSPNGLKNSAISNKPSSTGIEAFIRVRYDDIYSDFSYTWNKIYVYGYFRMVVANVSEARISIKPPSSGSFTNILYVPIGSGGGTYTADHTSTPFVLSASSVNDYMEIKSFAARRDPTVGGASADAHLNRIELVYNSVNPSAYDPSNDVRRAIFEMADLGIHDLTGTSPAENYIY